MKLIRDDAVIDSLVAAVMELQNRESTSLPLYEKQLREVETGIQNMLNAIQARHFDQLHQGAFGGT